MMTTFVECVNGQVYEYTERIGEIRDARQQEIIGFVYLTTEGVKVSHPLSAVVRMYQAEVRL